MKMICFVVCYLLLSLISDSSTIFIAKNESVDLLTHVKNNDNSNINNTLKESRSNANSSLHFSITLPWTPPSTTWTYTTSTWTPPPTRCGGFYTKPYGVLTSPNYPDNYPPNAQCIYQIWLETGKLVNITFHKIEIETQADCRFDYLQVRNGATEYSPLIAQLCGTTVPAPLISTTNRLWMKFKTDHHLQYGGFYATYHAIENNVRGCGGILTSSNGTFTSPNFPNDYENNLDCGWLIQVHPDERILLTFLDFYLESHEDCFFDAVEVYDGSNVGARLLGRFCGTIIPKPLSSKDNRLFVRFKSDSSNRYRGFEAEYKITNCDCGPYGDCSFTFSGRKNCHCNKGYADRGGFCSFCDCGPHGRCNFNYWGDKYCNCDYGYNLRNGFCSGYDKDVIDNKGEIRGWQIATYVCVAFISVIIIGMLIILATKCCTRKSRINQQELNRRQEFPMEDIYLSQ